MDQVAVLLLQFHLCVNTFVIRFHVFYCMYVCCWPPAPDPQLGESWPLEQVHMLGLEQKPSPHEFLQIAGKRKRRVNWISVVFSYTWWNRIIQRLFVIFSLGFVVYQRWVMGEELTNNTLVPSWQSLPAWTAVWVEARATHIGSDGDKKERTNKFTSHPDLPNIF